MNYPGSLRESAIREAIHLPVSIPEKTLEHWASMYVTYRFRSKAALWWPTKGEDIDVRAFPKLPGKALQLEMKTTVPGAGGAQDVLVDLGQLWDYQRTKCPPFYVFPWPDWSGTLEAAALAAAPPRQVTESAFGRSGAWWFAHWTRVLDTAQVARVLAPELKRHGNSARGVKARLVRVDPTGSAPPQWGASGKATPPNTVEWRTFWDRFQACGDGGWPQLIRLPRSVLSRGETDTYTLTELRRELILLGGKDGEIDGGPRKRRYDMTKRTFEDLVTLAPNRNGAYVIIPDHEGDLGGGRNIDNDGEVPDRRQAVFVDARVVV